MRMEHWLYAMPLRLRSLFRRQRVEQELDDQLQYHLERKTEEYIAGSDTQAIAPGRLARHGWPHPTQRGMPGRAGGKRHRSYSSGSPLQPAGSGEDSGFYGSRSPYAGARDRRQRHGFWRIEWADTEPAEGASGAESLRHRTRER